MPPPTSPALASHRHVHVPSIQDRGKAVPDAGRLYPAHHPIDTSHKDTSSLRCLFVIFQAPLEILVCLLQLLLRLLHIATSMCHQSKIVGKPSQTPVGCIPLIIQLILLTKIQALFGLFGIFQSPLEMLVCLLQLLLRLLHIATSMCHQSKIVGKPSQTPVGCIPLIIQLILLTKIQALFDVFLSYSKPRLKFWSASSNFSCACFTSPRPCAINPRSWESRPRRR